MKILITGATGFIGNSLAHQLADAGHEIHALVHNKANALLVQHKNIRVFFGDITNVEQVKAAIHGCEQVYHTAAQVKPWQENPSIFYEVNVEGTLNVFEQALQGGIRKIVFTSTCGVLGPTSGEPLKEASPPITDHSMHYDRSKKMAEDIVLSYSKKGLSSLIVSPSKVFGPGNTSHSLTANAIISTFLKKRIIFIPAPGIYKLCFAYVDDVVKGHVLAMENGKSGEKYILGGQNITYYDFFDRIRILANRRAHIFRASKLMTKCAAYMQEVRHAVTGAPVLFSVKSVGYAFNNYTFSSEKAIQQLGYTITSLDESLIKTIQFLKKTN